jgi:formate hydrogenlyase transcriptional activator
MASPTPESQQRTLAHYQALLEISELLAADRQLPELFRDLNQSLGRIIPFDGMGLSLYDLEHQTTQLFLIESSKPGELAAGRTFSLNETPASEVLETQRPFWVPDIDRENHYPVLDGILRRHGIHSYCVLPLSTARRRLGGLHFASSIPNAYSPEDIEFMQVVARDVAAMLENTLRHESAAADKQKLAREQEHLQLLLQVNNAVAAELDTRKLFSAISVCLREALNVEFASLALFDPETKQLRRHSLDFPGGSGLIKENAVIPIELAPIGEAFVQGRPVISRREDIQRLPSDVAEGVVNEGLNFICAVPLKSRKRILGTINVASRREDAFTEAGIKLLEEVACQFAVALDNALAYQHIEELNTKLAEEKLYLADEIRDNYFFEEIIGSSQPLQHVLRQVEVVAPSDSTVLICGETGTGKEQIARAIHNLSVRRQSTFVKLNCAAIPTGLMESEMFGHEKGAFTGAVAQRIGRFELAHHGTIFLDEIGDIPIELQPKLLRVLQEQEFERLGSARTVHVDVRVIAATNKDLLQMVNDGEFRADLYYRLNVFPINMPPLHDRPEDIPLLVRHFAQQVSRRVGKQITTINSETMDELVHYSWPGNIRELQNLIERAVILSPGSVLKVPLRELKASTTAPGNVTQTLEEAERRHIVSVLQKTNWVIGGPNGAAAQLGMKRSTLQFRMHKLHIFRPK